MKKKISSVAKARTTKPTPSKTSFGEKALAFGRDNKKQILMVAGLAVVGSLFGFRKVLVPLVAPVVSPLVNSATSAIASRFA